jgi:hypothetical protein
MDVRESAMKERALLGLRLVRVALKIFIDFKQKVIAIKFRVFGYQLVNTVQTFRMPARR